MLTKIFYLFLVVSTALALPPKTSELTKEELCRLPPLHNMHFQCKRYSAKPHYTFNSTANECQPFRYGGCGRTENLFNNEEDCKATCGTIPAPRHSVDNANEDDDSICSLPPDASSEFSCEAYMPRWTFNSKTGVCERYIYGGCGATKNLFHTESECLKKCSRKAKTVELTKDQLCSLPPLKNMDLQCKMYSAKPHYTFNSTTKDCQPFRYGGCGRTENLFNNEEDCKATCGTIPAPRSKVELTKEQLCSLPPLKHMDRQCKMYSDKPHYTFNSTANECQPFRYGGCGRTENLFNNEEECKAACGTIPAPPKKDELTKEQLCSLPPLKNMKIQCKIHFEQPHYTYNSTANECQKFDYGGCGRTENLFNNLQDCKAACGTLPVPPKKAALTKEQLCSLKPLKNMDLQCKMYSAKPHYTFNSTTNECQEFNYGGCGRTENLFNNLQDCKATCGTLPTPRHSIDNANEVDESICSLPPVEPSPFSCLAAFPKWTFNSKTGVCERYIYGGCGATQNLFNTESECLKKCNRKALLRSQEDQVSSTTSPCLLPQSPGSCRARINAFYFDTETKSCNSFTYTGCRGNENNFVTVEDCQEMCSEYLVRQPPVGTATSRLVKAPAVSAKGEPSRDALCSLPPLNPEQPFSCMAYMPSWTFNSKTNQCEPYVYGGCGKTANVFSNEEECKKACDPKTNEQSQLRHRDSCLLPVDKGPCFALKPRYAFKKDKNRCEVFTFGGCQGNQNNFRTGEECQDTCGGDAPSKNPECELASCPISNKRYTDRGCLPVYSGNSCCPTSFRCLDEEPEVPVCYYRGVIFQVGEEIPLVTQDIPHKTHCVCKASSLHTGGATIDCREIMCGWPMKPNDGCVLRYDDVCPYYQCPEAGETINKEVCQHNGKKYAEGESIPSGDPCKSCTCQEGFNGLNGPGCEEIQCLVNNRIGYVPVYVQSHCCPISYNRAEDFQSNKTTIIRREPETANVGVSTLPIRLTDNKSDKERCLLPKVVGICKMLSRQFYYDADQKKCAVFTYGGCQGNANRFATEQKCMEACEGVTRPIEVQEPRSKTISPPVSLPEEPAANTCLLPKVIGPCRAASHQFHYDAGKQSCVGFIYGGCDGNANRFSTEEKCLKTCSGVTLPPPVLSRTRTLDPAPTPAPASATENIDRCKLPSDVGFCRMKVNRFFYDSQSGQCKRFTWGGCMGNANRFVTEEKCMEACSPQVSPVANMRARGLALPRARIGGELDSEGPSDVRGVSAGARVHGARFHGARIHGAESSQETKENNDLKARVDSTSVCTFGNLTLNIGDRIEQSDSPCDECECSTPPELTCIHKSCPPHPANENIICKQEYLEGQCCPNYSCVSANPPTINVCENVKCAKSQVCEVKSQESDDGAWLLPIGVCV